MKTYNQFLLIAVALITALPAFSQESTAFSLNEAEDFGVNNNVKVKNALLEIEIARKKVWETTAIGLPQVSAQGQFQQLLDIPVQVVDAQLFNPMAEEGDVLEFRAGQEFTSSLTFNATQLLFDGSYIVGLQFSKFFQKMTTTSADITKKEIKALVREAYYNVLVAEENLNLLDSILTSTKELWEKTAVFVENGFIPKDQADQVEIAYNRVKGSRLNAERQKMVATNLLKLQMGYDFDKEIALKETLEEVLEALKSNSPLLSESSITQNSNYILLDQKRQLDEFNLKNQKAAYLPSLGAFFTHSQNAFRNEFNFFQNEPWFPTTIWGVSLNVPITSSGQKIVRVQQAEILIEQDKNDLDGLKKNLKLQELQLKSSFQTATETADLEKSCVALAKRVYDNAIKKSESGVISALEVTQLQNQLLTAEGNYIRAIMEMLSIKVQLDKLYSK